VHAANATCHENPVCVCVDKYMNVNESNQSIFAISQLPTATCQLTP
jgi:hypothetical protein